MRANCNSLVSVVYPPNKRKVAGSSPARNIVNTFCSHLLSSFYKGLLCRNAWLIFSYALFKHRIFLSRLTNIISVIVYFVFSFSYLKKLYVFETSRLSGFRGCLHFLLDSIVVTAQKHTTRVRWVWVHHNYELNLLRHRSADRLISNNQNGHFFCYTHYKGKHYSSLCELRITIHS